MRTNRGGRPLIICVPSPSSRHHPLRAAPLTQPSLPLQRGRRLNRSLGCPRRRADGLHPGGLNFSFLPGLEITRGHCSERRPERCPRQRDAIEEMAVTHPWGFWPVECEVADDPWARRIAASRTTRNSSVPGSNPTSASSAKSSPGGSVTAGTVSCPWDRATWAR